MNNKKINNKETNVKPAKKRGRKPKGGKILTKTEKKVLKKETLENNVILHLKINNHSEENQTPEYFNINKSNNNFLNKLDLKNNSVIRDNYQKINNSEITNKENCINTNNTSNNKEVWEKINELKLTFQRNNTIDKRSCCFWDTCHFDNPPIYIPKQEVNGSTEVYGCFCSPECAVAYLKKEKLDSSTLWERYALLNTIYSKVFEYKDNIKPAPCPYYTLDKYYGNLTIDEYRQLLGKQHFLLVVERPLTKIMPEIHDDLSESPNIYNNLLTNKNKENLSLKRGYSTQRQIF